MKSPTDDEIDDVLEQLQRTRMEIVDEWMSDAEKLNLPLVNRTHSGSPLLKVDDVLRASCPNHARK